MQLRCGMTCQLQSWSTCKVRIVARFNSTDDIYVPNYVGEAFIGITQMPDGTEWVAEYKPDGTRLWEHTTQQTDWNLEPCES